MGVHDAYAGRGVGSALMAAVIELADRWLNLKRLELEVWADNYPAIALYEKFGFEREGLLRAEGFRDGVYADSLAMARLRGL
jgi:putative acetyltransferase